MMTFLRPTKYTLKIFTSLIILLVCIYVLGSYFFNDSDAFGPIVVFLIYAPLFLADGLGLPVYGQSSGWWNFPGPFGWIFLTVFYVLISYLFSSLMSRFLESRKK